MPNFSSAQPRTIAEKLGEFRSVLDFGAVADAVVLTDAAMTSGSDLLNSASAGFTVDVVGKWFVVVGADGSTSDPLVGTCLARVSATSVQLSVSATATVSAAKCVYGTDNQDAFDAAYANCKVRGNGSLFVPAGRYLYRGAITAQSHVHLHGRGASSILYSASFAAGGESALIAHNLTSCGFFNIAFESDAEERKTNEENARLLIRGCTDVEFENIHVDGSNTVGIFITNSQRVRGGDVFIQNTMADGLHTTNGSRNVRVNSINGYNTGDDTAAIVSYAGDPAGQVEDVVYGFVKSVNSQARGFGIVGPKNCQVLGYQIENPKAHGFVIAYEPAFSTFVPSWIKIGPGKIKGATFSPSFNGFIVGGTSGNIPEHIEVTGAILEDCNQALVTYSKRVRIERMEKTAGNYRGMLVQNCEQVDVIGCTFRDTDDEALTFDNVTRGRIDDCSAYECQVVANASRGRFSVLDSRQIIGKGNYDFRDTISTSSLGPLLVSNASGTDFITNFVEVNGNAPDNSLHRRAFGMLYDSQRQMLRLENDLEPIDDVSFGIVSHKGLYTIDGPIQIDGNHALRGSGGAAWLKLFGGFVQASSPTSIELTLNNDGSGTGETFTIRAGSTPVNILTLDTSGNMFVRGGFLPSNASSAHGLYAITGGSPNGVIAASVGSLCLRDWGSLSGSGSDATIYVKTSGAATNTGWEIVSLANELPSITGNARKALRVNNAGSGVAWSKVPIDDPGAIELSSILGSRYIYHDAAGSGQLVGKDSAGVWADIEPFAATALSSNATFVAAMKTALNHTHNYEDVEPGSTSTALSPPNDHSHTVSDIAVTKVTGSAIY